MSAGEESEPWVVYEWASIRVVPLVHREQFVNVAVLLHARQAHFLETRVAPQWEERLLSFAPDIDRHRVERHLESYVRICRGDESASPIALLPPSERFHWLIHPRSGIIQTSRAHPGRCHDPKGELERLLKEQCG
jgi:Protein of unknown function (DUF3037)